jgi:hypothetical protein
LYALPPRVGSVLAGLANPRQPWAGGRNPFGIADAEPEIRRVVIR